MYIATLIEPFAVVTSEPELIAGFIPLHPDKAERIQA